MLTFYEMKTPLLDKIWENERNSPHVCRKVLPPSVLKYGKKNHSDIKSLLFNLFSLKFMMLNNSKNKN